MPSFGLLGRQLSHSYSPQIHKAFGCSNYELICIEPDKLKNFFQNKNFRGINVTIPYKKSVTAYIDSISEEASALGSINTIICKSDGTLHGYNTDIFGFNMLVKKSNVDITGKKALILGNGGSTPIIKAILEKHKASNIIIVSRSGEVNYNNLQQHSDAQIIVNATPVGMFPNIDSSLIDICNFPQLEAVFDLIYNPLQTKLLQDAHKHGIACFNGLLMLVAQAAKAEELFFDIEISQDKIMEVYSWALQQIENGGF